MNLFLQGCKYCLFKNVMPSICLFKKKPKNRKNRVAKRDDVFPWTAESLAVLAAGEFS